MYNNYFNYIYNSYNKRFGLKAPSIAINTNQQNTTETGLIAVGVFTALQALPVKGAEVTVYDILDDGSEHIHANLLTDDSGRIPDIELPVKHDSMNSFGSNKYYYTIYNLRVKAKNFYTVNVLNIHIFPGIKSNHRIDLIPLISGDTGNQEQTFIIPISPIDESNY